MFIATQFTSKRLARIRFSEDSWQKKVTAWTKWFSPINLDDKVDSIHRVSESKLLMSVQSNRASLRPLGVEVFDIDEETSKEISSTCGYGAGTVCQNSCSTAKFPTWLPTENEWVLSVNNGGVVTYQVDGDLDEELDTVDVDPVCTTPDSLNLVGASISSSVVWSNRVIVADTSAIGTSELRMFNLLSWAQAGVVIVDFDIHFLAVDNKNSKLYVTGTRGLGNFVVQRFALGGSGVTFEVELSKENGLIPEGVLGSTTLNAGTAVFDPVGYLYVGGEDSNSVEAERIQVVRFHTGPAVSDFFYEETMFWSSVENSGSAIQDMWLDHPTGMAYVVTRVGVQPPHIVKIGLNECSGLTCDECTSNPSCGWCHESDGCLRGDEDQPTFQDACAGGPSSWNYNTLHECPNPGLTALLYAVVATAFLCVSGAAIYRGFSGQQGPPEGLMYTSEKHEHVAGFNLSFLRRRFSSVAAEDMPDYNALKYGAAWMEESISLDKPQKAFVKMITKDSPDFLFASALIDSAPRDQVDAVVKALAIIGVQHGLISKLLDAFLSDALNKANPGDSSTLFRSNTNITKLFDVYSKITGAEFLYLTLAPVLKELAHADIDLEIDPKRIKTKEAHQQDINAWTLLATNQKVLNALTSSLARTPLQLRLFAELLVSRVSKKYSKDVAVRAVGSFVFLRFFIPAMTTPKRYELMKENPTKNALRLLILVSKTLLNLANGVMFGNKEPHMVKMNDFLTANREAISEYFEKFADIDPKTDPPAVHLPPHVYNNAVAFLARFAQDNQETIVTAVEKKESKTKEKVAVRISLRASRRITTWNTCILKLAAKHTGVVGRKFKDMAQQEKDKAKQQESATKPRIEWALEGKGSPTSPPVSRPPSPSGSPTNSPGGSKRNPPAVRDGSSGSKRGGSARRPGLRNAPGGGGSKGSKGSRGSSRRKKSGSSRRKPAEPEAASLVDADAQSSATTSTS